jgi:hypothetical protein
MCAFLRCVDELLLQSHAEASRRHGFGVGPAGAKFTFAQQYLRPLELHAPAWHLPSFAETRLSHSIEIVEQFMLQVSACVNVCVLPAHPAPRTLHRSLLNLGIALGTPSEAQQEH